MPFDFNFGELLVIGIVALLLFGGKLPEVAKKAGKTIHEFRRGMREEARRIERDLEPPPEPPPPPPPPQAG